MTVLLQRAVFGGYLSKHTGDRRPTPAHPAKAPRETGFTAAVRI